MLTNYFYNFMPAVSILLPEPCDATIYLNFKYSSCYFKFALYSPLCNKSRKIVSYFLKPIHYQSNFTNIAAITIYGISGLIVIDWSRFVRCYYLKNQFSISNTVRKGPNYVCWQFQRLRLRRNLSKVSRFVLVSRMMVS